MRINYSGRIPVRDLITIFPPIDQFWLHGIGRLWSHKHTLYTSWFLGEKNLEYFPFYFIINRGETRVGWGTFLGFKDKNESPVDWYLKPEIVTPYFFQSFLRLWKWVTINEC